MPRCASHLLAILLAGLPAAANADIVLSSNDGHTVQDDQKHLVAPKEVHPDTISVIDVARYPPRIVATADVPAAWSARPQRHGSPRTRPGRS